MMPDSSVFSARGTTLKVCIKNVKAVKEKLMPFLTLKLFINTENILWI